MIKPYLNILVMLLLSWSVYGFCQHDYLLPVMGGLVILVTFAARFKTPEKQYALFEQIPLSAVIIVPFLLGLLWRNIVPIPAEAVSPYPEYAAALQSGSVIAGVLIWLRPFSKLNTYRLVFCAWLTVALSMNVPVTEERLMVFTLFSFISIAVVIFNTMKKPADKKYRFLYIRDYVIFSTLLIMLTTALFLGISTAAVAFEHAFMRTMSEYIMPRNYTHFLRISSQLNLISPGISAFDRRPVMEIKLPPNTSSYLKMQVFTEYKNGTWNEPKEIKKVELPQTLPPGNLIGKTMMFTSFKDLVPGPEGVVAVKAKAAYSRSNYQILSSENAQNTRMLEYALTSTKENAVLSDEEYQRYTAVPPEIAGRLKEIADSIVNADDDVKTKANKIAQYFRDNFSYSLDVTFSADDKGLLKMIEDKRPAYCTYFASALALLLRTEGIPTRVAAGFYSNEVIDPKSNTYLVRVSNAHAWTEVYAPLEDPATGQTVMLWRRLDATPANFDAVLTKDSKYYLEKMFENMWLGVLRISAYIENMDKDKLKLYVIIVLLAWMAFINRQKIAAGLRQWIRGQKSAKKVHYQTPDMLRTIYQQYESYLKDEYGEMRGPADTDGDVIQRIKQKSAENKKPVNRIEEFINEFHAVRFGARSPDKLPGLLKDCETSSG
ncbi:MAG: transglutaminase domain-containing protein [Candidatus Omnitrophica bacterium]|nr:transglutaminase domain-containing protein [Candidatus Omnitrophota bacterium]